jgi:hypothetical protein
MDMRTRMMVISQNLRVILLSGILSF